MIKKSPFYYHSLLYFLGFKLLHKCDVALRNKFIASFADKGETVLEPGCGPGSLADSIPGNVNYVGFDLNKSFISYALKKKLNVYLGDVLKEKSYKKADVVVACDILHHLKLEDRKRFVKYSYSNARRIYVFCECVKETKGLWRKTIYPISSRVFEFLDRDGINKPKYEDVYTKEQLQKEYDTGFGIIPKSTKRIVKQFGCDLLAVYYKE